MNYSVSLLYLLLQVFSIWLLYLNTVKRAIYPLMKFTTSPHPLSSDGASKWRRGKESACQCRRCQRHGLDPWNRKIPWRRAWQPTPVSCLENPMNKGAWRATTHGVTKSNTTEWLSACTHTSSDIPLFNTVSSLTCVYCTYTWD